MLEINLLPEEIKKKKSLLKMPDVTEVLLPILVGVVVILILAHIALQATVAIKEKAYQRINKEWEKITPEKKAVDTIQNENEKAKKRLGAIKVLVDRRILWSKKLNELSDSLVSGIWFARLSLEEKKIAQAPLKAGVALAKKSPQQESPEGQFLNLEGNVFSEYEDEHAIIRRFIDGLRTNSDFFKDFSKIELGSTELQTLMGMEVIKFSISCYLKERKAQ